MVSQNSIMTLLVGKNVNRTASATATDQTASTYLADGEIAITDISGTVLNTSTVQGVDRIKIVQSQGTTNPLISSPVIELAGLKSYNTKAYTAPVVQVDFIGYNTTTATGDIDGSLALNGYEIKIKDLNSYNWGSIGTEVYGMMVSDSTPTKCEVTDGLAVNLWQNTTRLVRKPFIVERVSAATFTASTGTTGTATVTSGSATVTVTGAVSEFPAGTYVRIGTTATSTLTLGYYKVASSTGTTITLDQPYQGSSSTFATTAFAFATAATVNASATGIKLTGQAPVFNTPQSTKPYVNRWVTTVYNAGTTTVTSPQTAGSEGSGSYPYMADLEYFLLGNEGFISRNDIPYVSPRANISSTGTYHILTLEWNSLQTGQIFNQQVNPKQLMIAATFTAGSAPTSIVGSSTAVQDVLNAWIPTSIGSGTLS